MLEGYGLTETSPVVCANRPPNPTPGAVGWPMPGIEVRIHEPDADGDGVAELRTPFLTGLNSPYGMALVGNTLYVANTDAVMAYPYTPGATSITTAIVPPTQAAIARMWPLLRRG